MEEDNLPVVGMKRRESENVKDLSSLMAEDLHDHKKQRGMEVNNLEVAGPTPWALGDQ